MVTHDITVDGITLKGRVQPLPALLQMNDDDFPKAFLQDLRSMTQPPPPVVAARPHRPLQQRILDVNQLSSATVLPTAGTSITLYQPVSRVVHVVLVQLSCESPGYPRVDPTRVLSAGLVIRQIPSNNAAATESLQWMRNAQGQFAWAAPDPAHVDDDPDPAQRPQLYSGRPELDRALAAQTLAKSKAEVFTPAFVAAPDVCNAAQRTLAYALIPTASSEASTTQPPSVAPMDSDTIRQMLPNMLKAGRHGSPLADQSVTYLYMSDDYARANNGKHFLCFSAALRMLTTVFGAFEENAQAQALIHALNRRTVLVKNQSGVHVREKIGQFYRDAYAKLIEYDANTDAASNPPQLIMPSDWEFFDASDEAAILRAMAPLLQTRGRALATPQGRFQDSTRLYRARLFFRIKSENPQCPPQLVWSCYSDPFRIAAWYESSGRAVAPVPLPDPFDPNVLKNAKPTSAFAVPPSLMSAMSGASLSGLSSGSGPSGGAGIGLGWICSFSIPLITICAFFVLNIFISLLNIVFFWMFYIKICIPFPVPKKS
jgi:hypothetical protein